MLEGMAEMTETADVVVVGLGAVGSAALYRLALSGVRVIGIDRFHPPHDMGSSHGESRITRLAVGEGTDYAPLVSRSHEIWRELEAASDETLFLQTGGLIIGPREGGASHHGKDDFVRRTIAVATQNAIPHEVLDAAAIAARFPQFALRGDEMACFEPSAGLLFPERCIAVQLRLAAAKGAVIHCGEEVGTLTDIQGGVTIKTGQRVIHAARVILTAGAWLPTMAGGRLRDIASVYRQTLHWFGVQNPAEYAPGRFPVFIWMHGATEADYFYGFPALPGTSTVKVATEQYEQSTHPDDVDRSVAPAESVSVFEQHVAARLRFVEPIVRRSSACLYTVTPDRGFVLDTLPGRPDILIASACSGHGFKHSAAVGELLAGRALASGPVDAGPFGLARYAATNGTPRGSA
jgi:sarcosine oxidase